MAPKRLQDTSRCLQDRPRSPQDPSKMPLRALKTTSNSLRERSGRSQEPASLHQEGSRSSSGASGGLKEPPQSLLEASEHLPRAFKKRSRTWPKPWPKQFPIPQNDDSSCRQNRRAKPQNEGAAVDRRMASSIKKSRDGESKKKADAEGGKGRRKGGAGR